VLESSDQLDKAVRYLVRVGYDNIAGNLKSGIEALYNSGFKVEHLDLSTIHDLKQRLDHGEDLLILDVRYENGWNERHIRSKHSGLHTPISYQIIYIISISIT